MRSRPENKELLLMIILKFTDLRKKKILERNNLCFHDGENRHFQPHFLKYAYEISMLSV